MRGLQAYLRNLPTLIHVFAEKYQEAALAGKNTEAMKTQRILSQLRDPRKLLMAVGLAQLLEIYVVASLQSQHSRRFPTQTWTVISEMREKVRALGERWEWEEEELKYAGIEAPKTVLDRLVRNGLYRPAVSKASALQNRLRRETNMVTKEQIKDLFGEENEAVRRLAGEVQMEVPLVWRLRRGRPSVARGEVPGEVTAEGEVQGGVLGEEQGEEQ